MSLKRGDNGPEVEALQNQIRSVTEASFALPGEILFSLRTEAFVRLYQEYKGLLVDGIVGPKTQAALATEAPHSLNGELRYYKNVPYFSQRDNVYNPSGTCNVTCLAMLLASRGVQAVPGKQLEDELFEVLQSDAAWEYYQKNFPELAKQSVNVNTVHGMLDWVASKYGVKLGFQQFTGTGGVMRALDKCSLPAITSGAFTGSGHIVLVVGYAVLEGHIALIVHDPWGDWNTGYRNRDGALRVYSDTVWDILSHKHNWYWFHFIKEE